MTDPRSDALADLLAGGGPPATTAGLAAVVARRHAIGRRRLQLTSAVALVAAGSMAGLLAAGGTSPSSAAGRSRAPVAAGPLQAPAVGIPSPSYASGAGPSSGRPEPPAGPTGVARPVAAGELSLAFRGRLGGVEVRAYTEQAPTGSAAVSASPGAAGRAAAGARGGSRGAPGCAGGGALLLELSDSSAVGRVVVPAGPVTGRIAGAAAAVVGAAEGAPFEVVAARLPARAVSATARFGTGAPVAATVRDGWAMAVRPVAGPAGVPVQLAAVGAGGRRLARVAVAAGAAAPTPCPATGGAGGR